jgi:hypothetical protein
VKSANLQLRERLLKDRFTDAKGVAALNVTDILNPEYSFFIADNAEEIKSAHSSQLAQFVIANQGVLVAKASKNVLGVICEYNQYGFVRDHKPFRIINCRGIKFFQYDNRPSSDRIVMEILRKISNQNIVKKYPITSG